MPNNPATIVAVCPSGLVTGGPEAAHQLVDMANEVLPGSGFICYHPFDEVTDSPEAYRMYNTPIIGREEIPMDAIVVLPEIWPDMIETFAQRCGFWWLSMDNFWDFGAGKPEAKIAGMRKAAIQLTQSEYARRYVDGKFGLHPQMLTDYINTSFGDTDRLKKRPRVAVNPAKGRHLIDVFTEWFPNIDVIELADMPRQQVAAELAASYVYIDFGHHPGRDRMPREAALSDVVVITTNTGAAANAIDMPINAWYKVETMEEVGDKVHNVLANFERHLAAQKPYAEIVKGQRTVFREEVERLLEFAASQG